ncbi:MAG: hypothetical protein ABDH32_05485 [Candidatus Caldarchaeales archaeon]
MSLRHRENIVVDDVGATPHPEKSGSSHDRLAAGRKLDAHSPKMLP